MTPWSPDTRAAAVDAILSKAPVLPVISINRIEDAVPLARALVAGGLPVLEVTLRSAIALEAIAVMVRDVPEAIIGAGTVLTPADLQAVEQTGARFAISPGATPALYEAAARCTIPWIPAIATASEIMQGLDFGHRRFKFFPATAAGGLPALKGFAGPFASVRFCPTGGIDAGSAGSFLAQPNVVTIGGSWMVPADRIAAGDWAAITALAQACAR